MTLKKSQLNLQYHPDAEKMLERLQQEYDALLIKVNEYYAARKALFYAKKQKITDDVERLALVQQYKELKKHLAIQQRHWQSLTTI